MRLTVAAGIHLRGRIAAVQSSPCLIKMVVYAIAEGVFQGVTAAIP